MSEDQFTKLFKYMENRFADMEKRFDEQDKRFDDLTVLYNPTIIFTPVMI